MREDSQPLPLPPATLGAQPPPPVLPRPVLFQWWGRGPPRPLPRPLPRDGLPLEVAEPLKEDGKGRKIRTEVGV